MDNQKFHYNHARYVDTSENAKLTAEIFQQVAASMGLQSIVFWSGSREGRPAAFFGTNDFREKSILELRLFGENINIGGFIHTENFTPPNKAFEEKWIEAAKGLLFDQAIKFKYEDLGEGHHRFIFNKQTDANYFMAIRESGHIKTLMNDPLREVPIRYIDYFKPPQRRAGEHKNG